MKKKLLEGDGGDGAKVNKQLVAMWAGSREG